MSELKLKSFEIRKDVLKMIYDAKTGHTGSDLSCTDILVALYYGVLNVNPENPEALDRDRYVQSKGHAVEVLWAVLADKGFFAKEELADFSAFGSRIIGHPNNKVAGIEMNTGSLGHGLSVSVGMALGLLKWMGKVITPIHSWGTGNLQRGLSGKAQWAADKL